MSLTPPKKVGQLQDALHARAKESPNYRFYAPYDKVYRADVLWHAYRICRSNDGSPGVDGQAFDDIEEYGQMKWLGELAEELRTKRYHPVSVRRVHIPKPGKPGQTRPLGIPTITDRVVMTAAMLVLEPIFEADLQPEQNAYRPNRSALDAVKQVSALLHSHHHEVIDADLSGYFDSIPHAELMKSVARRVSDRHMLRLIKMWLLAPVEETDESFDFLGYTFGRCNTAKTGRAYVSERPSKRKIQAVCRRISEVTDRRLCWRDTEEQVAQLNRIMVGWANYFCQGPVGKPYRIVTRHALRRLRRWLCRKHKVETGQALTRYPDKYLNKELGLARLYLRHRNVPWATA